jgi:hypothetical protein
MRPTLLSNAETWANWKLEVRAVNLLQVDGFLFLWCIAIWSCALALNPRTFLRRIVLQIRFKPKNCAALLL